VGPLDGYGR